jgi:hypothetical protein
LSRNKRRFRYHPLQQAAKEAIELQIRLLRHLGKSPRLVSCHPGKRWFLNAAFNQSGKLLHPKGTVAAIVRRIKIAIKPSLIME